MLKKTFAVCLTSLLIFLVPTNLFYKLAEKTAYYQGIFIDYLIPKVYLTDLLILLIISFYLIEKIPHQTRLIFPSIKLWCCRQWKTHKVLVCLSLILLIRQCFTPYPLAAVWFFTKILSMILLVSVSKKNLSDSFAQKQKIIPLSLTLTLVFQSLLVVMQYIYQKPLFGYLFLGEGSLAQPTGIAQGVSITGREYILPYGTTAHPNILAGIAVIFCYLVWLWPSHKKNPSALFLKITATLSATLILILTQSWSAILTVSILILAFFMKKIIAWSKQFQPQLLLHHNLAVLPFFILFILMIAPLSIHLLNKKSANIFSLSRRDTLNSAAIKLFVEQPFWGVGLDQFTVNLSTRPQTGETIPFMQPVHNIGWLILAETGILGAALIFTIYLSPMVMLVFLPIASFDHYLLTNQSGLLLVVLTWTILSLVDHKKPRVKEWE